MGNKASVTSKWSCVSAPMDDGEYSYSKSSKSSKSKATSQSHCEADSYSYSSSTPPAPSDHDDASYDDDDDHYNEYREDYPYYKMNIKLLFLDVDGVLNNPSTKFDEYQCGIDDKLLKYLKLIILKTNCKIVLSTTWRLNENAKQILLHTLKTRADLNTDDIVIGQTKSLKNRGKHRTNEIADYLRSNHYRFNVISWCALDDLPLNKYDQQSMKFMDGHFIRTNPKNGISPQNALSCIDILNQNDYQQNSYYHQRY